jgi:hypothetical protein
VRLRKGEGVNVCVCVCVFKCVLCGFRDIEEDDKTQIYNYSSLQNVPVKVQISLSHKDLNTKRVCVVFSVLSVSVIVSVSAWVWV